MKNITINNKLYFLKICFWFILTILLLFGGLGLQSIWLSWLMVLFSSIYLFLLFLLDFKIDFPRGAVSYTVFLILFFISLYWSFDAEKSLYYFFLFLSGGILWIAIYNYKNLFGNKDLWLDYVIIILGIIFGIFYSLNYINGVDKVNSFSIIFYSTYPLTHHHIGDFWVLIAALAIYKIFKKEWVIFSLPLLIVSFIFLYLSYSRSAYIALISGLYYFFYRQKVFGKFKKYIWISVLLGLILFIYISLNKGLLTHRLFYITGVVGFIKHPFGVGVGNFDYILHENPVLTGLLGYSAVADNIFLEFLTGMGIFSLTFIYWFLVVIKSFWKDKGVYNLEYKIMFVALMVNFMFNHIYFIPTILWLWFVCLGIAGRKPTNKLTLQK